MGIHHTPWAGAAIETEQSAATAIQQAEKSLENPWREPRQIDTVRAAKVRELAARAENAA
jgi:hypothetical protein